jgi:SNF2 family DNA or RNA helicase
MGITLTAANYIIRYSNTWSLEDTLQFESRIHRAGQDQKCFYYDIIVKDSIDEAVLEALQKKHNLATRLVPSGQTGFNEINEFLKGLTNGELIIGDGYEEEDSGEESVSAVG